MSSSQGEPSYRYSRSVLPTLAFLVAVVGLIFSTFPSVPISIKALFGDTETCDDPGTLSVPQTSAVIAASSALPNQSDNAGHLFTYVAGNAVDGDNATPWIPADRKGGVGQSLMLTWATPQNIRLVCIVNGYTSDNNTFVHNGTVEGLKVETDKGTAVGTLPIRSVYTQESAKAPLDRGATRSLKLTITSYRTAIEQGADPNRDTAISEVAVYVR